jgi:hypothetical protein
MEETYDMLKGYPPGTFPPQVLIEMNPRLPRSEKDRLLQMMAPKPEQQQVQQASAKLNLEHLAGRNAKQAADTRKTLAQADQATATAAEKRAKVTTEGARAAHLASESDLDGRVFVRDTLMNVHQIMQPFLNPPQGQQRAQGAPQR